MMYFIYGETEIEYLKKKDKRLARAIEVIGPIQRPIIPNLYHSLVNAIIGQQISTKAHQTIWQRMLTTYGDFTPEQIITIPIEEIQKIGISFRKANYIQLLTKKIVNGELNLTSLKDKSDQEVCDILVQLDGIGKWTAEMILLHTMQRPNILSYSDLAILRGIRMLYGHQTIDKKRFEGYRKRYSPYGSVASIYLWAISAGAIPTLVDKAVKK